LLLDKNQVIVSQRGRRSPYHAYYALHGNGGVRVPVVVLIDSGSASASEIVTGAIQDHDRGLVLGEVSFGKGLVQSVGSLSEGTGLALTTAHYYTPSGRLIQRDYHDVSFFDYEFNRKATIKQTEIKLTDSGRQVYGGGGITPDVNYATPKITAFQQVLLRKNVFYQFDIGVGDFTTFYLGTKPTVTKSYTVDDAAIAQFRKFLQKKNIPFTEQDITENLEWIKDHIKREVFTSMFGQQEGFRVEMESDPEVAKGIDLIPQSRALYEKARGIVAERMNGQNPGTPH
jgi:carboxyl-terminal processing protease